MTLPESSMYPKSTTLMQVREAQKHAETKGFFLHKGHQQALFQQWAAHICWSRFLHRHPAQNGRIVHKVHLLVGELVLFLLA